MKVWDRGWSKPHSVTNSIMWKGWKWQASDFHNGGKKKTLGHVRIDFKLYSRTWTRSSKFGSALASINCQIINSWTCVSISISKMYENVTTIWIKLRSTVQIDVNVMSYQPLGHLHTSLWKRPQWFMTHKLQKPSWADLPEAEGHILLAFREIGFRSLYFKPRNLLKDCQSTF